MCEECRKERYLHHLVCLKKSEEEIEHWKMMYYEEKKKGEASDKKIKELERKLRETEKAREESEEYAKIDEVINEFSDIRKPPPKRKCLRGTRTHVLLH